MKSLALASSGRLRLLLTLVILMSAPALPAQSLSPQLFNGLHWRLVGPFRAGRVVAVSGVPGSRTTYYFGGVDGGVWKTTDAGTVWNPVFDHEPVASIGAIAVAPSNPNVVYVGTGESDIRSDLASGDGIYRSDDAGKTWTRIGLTNTRQISRILVDPANANIVYVGALGHAYGPSEERGVYKSSDGGAHWQRVLDKGPDVGIADLAMAIRKPQVLFATTWNAHRPPWSTYPPIEGPGNGLYRSTDGGEHWTEISGHGLPTEAWGRTGVAVGAGGNRVYVTIDCPGHSGLYRSDDGGDTWRLVNSDSRLTDRAWYFMALAIDPNNSNVLYIPNVALYRTEDGGKTIQIVRGAPGGDDYHQIWIDPKNSKDLMLGVDQGATLSLDYGKTWTTWYNQPTAQLYHVTTDNRFPYAIYGAQQDSGSIAIYSRSDHQHIDTRDWFLPGGSESGYIAIDPKSEDIIYLTDTYGGVTRFNRRTSFSQDVTPWPLDGFDVPVNRHRYRDPWTPPLVFSPVDQTSLYLGTQYVLKTTDGGLHWQRISPDLTGAVSDTSAQGPTTIANAMQRGYGVVYTIAPSPLDVNEIWAGSDTGLIHLTTDGGKTWRNVTPPGLSPWSKISLIEASHFDPATAYAAVDRHRLDDQKPYLYITHNYGKTWSLSVNGIPSPDFLRAVREDPSQKNLLYAGTEFGIFVSFNDGNNWQPLQLNLPVSSVRDMDIHGSDLIVATHGRSFWVLDDIAPLRQAAKAAAKSMYLYAPPTAVRVDNDGFLGTPLPPEEPQANNPPDGAIVDYYLSGNARNVRLEILDAQGHVIRHYSSAAKATIKRPLLPIAERWFPKPQVLETAVGEHRFIWDLHTSGSGSGKSDPDDSDNVPAGPRVPPGSYTVRLLVDGVALQQSLRVTMDPRSPATQQVLEEQFTFASDIYRHTLATRRTLAELESTRSELEKIKTNTKSNSPALNVAVEDALKQVSAINGSAAGSPGLSQANADLDIALGMVESGDRTAPAQAVVIYKQMSNVAQQEIANWEQFKRTGLDRVNAELAREHQKPIQISAIEEVVHYAMTR